MHMPIDPRYVQQPPSWDAASIAMDCFSTDERTAALNTAAAAASFAHHHQLPPPPPPYYAPPQGKTQPPFYPYASLRETSYAAPPAPARCPPPPDAADDASANPPFDPPPPPPSSQFRPPSSLNGDGRNFPEILHDILSSDEHSRVISWLPHGRGFVVHDRARFTLEVLPRHFVGTKYTSFTRRLKRWRFARVSRGPERGAYYNENFARGRREQVRNMGYRSEGKFATGGRGRSKKDRGASAVSEEVARTMNEMLARLEDSSSLQAVQEGCDQKPHQYQVVVPANIQNASFNSAWFVNPQCRPPSMPSTLPSVPQAVEMTAINHSFANGEAPRNLTTHAIEYSGRRPSLPKTPRNHPAYYAGELPGHHPILVWPKHHLAERQRESRPSRPETTRSVISAPRPCLARNLVQAPSHAAACAAHNAGGVFAVGIVPSYAARNAIGTECAESILGTGCTLRISPSPPCSHHRHEVAGGSDHLDQNSMTLQDCLSMTSQGGRALSTGQVGDQADVTLEERFLAGVFGAQ